MNINRILLSPARSEYDNTAGGGSGVQGREPGSVDNRLSLDPSDPKWSDLIGSWKDGEEYDLKLKVSQISPGEFEVMDVNDEGGEKSPDDEMGEGEDMGGSTSENPALKKLMGE